MLRLGFFSSALIMSWILLFNADLPLFIVITIQYLLKSPNPTPFNLFTCSQALQSLPMLGGDGIPVNDRDMEHRVIFDCVREILNMLC